MRNWQKTLAVLLAAGMALGTTACGQDTTNKESGSSAAESGSAAESSSTVVEEAKDPVTLEWYFRGNGQQDDTDKVEEAVNELLKEYPGLEHVSININCFPSSDYAQQVALSQTSGAQMDIVNSVNLDFYQQVEYGTWMPMDEYISDELKENLPDWLWEMGTVDGQIYMVPNYQNAFNTQYLFFPKEYMDKYGDYDAMKATLQDESLSLAEKAACLEEYVMAVREGEGDTKYAARLGQGADSGSYGFGFTTPFDKIINKFIVVDGTNQVIHAYEQDFFKESWAIYADWYDKGIFSPDGEATEVKNYYYGNMMQETSSVFCPKEMYGTEERAAKTYAEQWGFEVVAIQTQPYNFIQKSWGAGGNGISSTSEHPEEAAKFLEAINTGSEIGKKIYNTLVFGLEGEHWVWEDEANDRIRTLEYDGSQGSVDTSYAGLKWIIGNSFYAYKNQAVLDDQYPVAKELNESPDTVTSSLIGFVPDTSSIQTQLEQITAVEKEYDGALNSGTKGSAGWEAHYNEMFEKMREAGLDEVKAELQRQLDEFLANK